LLLGFKKIPKLVATFKRDLYIPSTYEVILFGQINEELFTLTASGNLLPKKVFPLKASKKVI
jgi:hypothetical protein